MIIVRIMGGLGNQMFQYACGRALSYKLNTNLELNFVYYQGDTKREYELDCFNLTDNISVNKVEKQQNIGYSLLRLIKRYVLKSDNLYIEKSRAYDADVFKLSDGFFIKGYWQSEKYYKDIEDVIRKDFTFKYKPNKKNSELLKNIKKTNSVSVHVRRGDYVQDSKTNEYHGICGLDYYRKAFGIIGRKVEEPHFFVFSDDISWCKDSLKLEKGTVYVDYNKGPKSYEDMRLMSNCKHHIIANSSFSWWGAWLNKNKDKVVIVPKKWFKEESVNTKDQIPAGWIKI
jgi:hypothetical protein